MENALAVAASVPRPSLWASLGDPKRTIAGPVRDLLLFWGAPAVALLAVLAYVTVLPSQAMVGGTAALASVMSIVTYSHLIAVVPRAYLNPEVFAAHRARLIVAPIVLVAAMALSRPLLALGGAVIVFWDIHHSAMQTFGIGRIYDLRAGNDVLALRRVDMALNWALYVGPLAAGAALVAHFEAVGASAKLGWEALAIVPDAHATRVIHVVAVVAWLGVVGYAIAQYRALAGRGYRLPSHKAALLATTAVVSIVSWVLLPPILAVLIANLFHAVQYFSLVWLKEGKRMRILDGGRGGSVALLVFLGLCAGFGTLYWATAHNARGLLAPFFACSLLHFWYDGFIWSVRKRQV